jgi:hypothetical protein
MRSISGTAGNLPEGQAGGNGHAGRRLDDISGLLPGNCQGLRTCTGMPSMRPMCVAAPGRRATLPAT